MMCRMLTDLINLWTKLCTYILCQTDACRELPPAPGILVEVQQVHQCQWQVYRPKRQALCIPSCILFLCFRITLHTQPETVWRYFGEMNSLLRRERAAISAYAGYNGNFFYFQKLTKPFQRVLKNIIYLFLTVSGIRIHSFSPRNHSQNNL